MKTSRVIFLVAILAGLVWGGSALLGKDTYVGFFYPDASNLFNDIQSAGTFESLEMCRDWVDEQVSIHNPSGAGYDYECGKNCDLSGGKPYVCEETLE
jgi:hypothetical protein